MTTNTKKEAATFKGPDGLFTALANVLRCAWSSGATSVEMRLSDLDNMEGETRSFELRCNAEKLEALNRAARIAKAMMLDIYSFELVNTDVTDGFAFFCHFKATDSVFSSILTRLQMCIPPDLVVTTLNGNELQRKKPIGIAVAYVPTEIRNEEGELARALRHGSVRIYEPELNETAYLFEYGVPVLRTNDKYHMNMLMRMPLDRNGLNITEDYLCILRARTLEIMHKNLSKEDWDSAWVKSARNDPNLDPRVR